MGAFRCDGCEVTLEAGEQAFDLDVQEGRAMESEDRVFEPEFSGENRRELLCKGCYKAAMDALKRRFNRGGC